MIHLVAGHTDEISRWVSDRVKGGCDFGPCEGLAIMQDDKLIAGVIYHEYRPDYKSIQLSMAADSPRWAKRDVIAQLLQYPFEQLGVYRLFTMTPVWNKLAIKTNSHIGLKQEAVLNSMFGENQHGVVMRMLKPDYNRLYARIAHGKKST
jgi:RimJ/RimL family protein N-acetyltransferase